jgi:endonuclease YncB( thermonuclease family)
MARFIIDVAFVVALILPAAVVPGSAQQAAGDACDGVAMGDVTVASVLDGRTFKTTDNQEVRLAGIATSAKASLEQLIAGQIVTLKAPARSEDRYGRIMAYVYVRDASIQQQLLRDGQAYAAGHIEPKPCLDTLFAAEQAARRDDRGFWNDPELRPKSAANRDDILRAKGRFTLVEGRVLGVRENGATIYLNFGTYYTRDFSVAIRKRNAARFAVAPKLMQDRRVRVRGVVEARRGPFIAAEWPGQIELIE